ncbi:ATP-binding protein [Cohnella faecalis]|uniref:sensor histidine kinase n=1 Tax=Cohnella faecalis TaxID=2315694 RepID=UPI0011C228C9|nr:HAMP domain-containing sensor histidine kinase [Cohnella faecalis]
MLLLLENLLLHLLIVVAPNLVFVSFQDRLKYGHAPILFGLIQGGAAVCSVVFSMEADEAYWNLHIVPLVISFLYAGPLAGCIVFVCAFAAQLSMGEFDRFGMALLDLLAAAIPAKLGPGFASMHPRRRRMMFGLSITLPLLFPFMFHYLYIQFNENTGIFEKFEGLESLLFGFIYLLGIWVAGKLNETMLERKRSKLEHLRAEKLDTLGELAASIAHEVRNPLTVVKGFLQLMQRKDQDKAQAYLPIALDELERAETVIGNYLSFSKPHLKKMEPFCLSTQLSEVHALLLPLAGDRGVCFTFEAENGVTVTGDSAQLRQAIVHIVKNAIEATPTDGNVWVAMRSEGGEAVVEVKDSGVGMTEEQLERIGTLFYSTKVKGTGLGMTVAWRIIRQMGGDLVYRSRPNIGTEVTITLPAGKAAKSAKP